MARESGMAEAQLAPPSSLAAELRSLDRRVLPRDLEGLIVRLCAWKPLSLREMARLLRRDDVYLQNTVIKRLLEDGRLDFLHRGQPNHPHQAYVVGAARRRERPSSKPRQPVAPRAVSVSTAVPKTVPAPLVRPLPMEMTDIGRND
jgi:hypothetical protein